MKTKIHVYLRDSINTDEIIPARYLNTYDEKELAKHAMEDIDPDFINKVQDGDFIIAGEDFGCGSSREHAIWSLRGAGIKGIIAKSFSRIFYRNAINNGFLAIECKEIDDQLKTGDEIMIDLDNGYFVPSPQSSAERLRRSVGCNGEDKYNFSPISEFVKNIMEKGGLLNTIE